MKLLDVPQHQCRVGHITVASHIRDAGDSLKGYRSDARMGPLCIGKHQGVA
jgi:hypothetical protein